MSTLRQVLALTLYIVASHIDDFWDAARAGLLALVLGAALWLIVFGVLLLGPQP